MATCQTTLLLKLAAEPVTQSVNVAPEMKNPSRTPMKLRYKEIRFEYNLIRTLYSNLYGRVKCGWRFTKAFSVDDGGT